MLHEQLFHLFVVSRDVQYFAHVALAYNDTVMPIYVNGTFVSTTNNTAAIRTSTGALRIAGNGVWGEYFAGAIDEVRVYNRALGATNVQADMARAISAKPAP